MKSVQSICKSLLKQYLATKRYHMKNITITILIVASLALIGLSYVKAHEAEEFYRKAKQVSEELHESDKMMQAQERIAEDKMAEAMKVQAEVTAIKAQLEECKTNK